MNPYFLIGAERSGTTLLRLMLNGHPEISWLNEFEYAVDQINIPNEWPEIKTYTDYLSTNRIFLASEFELPKNCEYPDIIKNFLFQKLSRDQKSIIGATCHRHYDRLLRIFPNARFIYLYRDPRDVSRSAIGMGWAGNVWYGVDRWIQAEQLWANVKDQLNKSSSYIEISYEDLIITPEKTLSEICNFLNVNFDHNMLAYPEYTSYSTPDIKLIHQWKRKLSNYEINLVEFKASSYMKNRGYHLKYSSPKKPASISRILLKIHDKSLRVLFRIKRYGFRLVLKYFISRSLGLKKMEQIMKLRINEITINHLK